MTKPYFTGQLKIKGWKVKDALSFWGRSYDWWTDNCNGDKYAHRRLDCMINGLPNGCIEWIDLPRPPAPKMPNA